jgi:hypothetical protein
MKQKNAEGAGLNSVQWQRPALRVALAAMLTLSYAGAARAEMQVISNRNGEDASASFRFQRAAAPSRNDAATAAKFTLLDGRRDGNGGGLEQLHDGLLPAGEDEPSQNFFFAAGTSGGRVLVEFDQPKEIKEVNTYSWHPGSRGPQVYKFYAADGLATNFNARPESGSNPERAGWRQLAEVDTRANGGGQYGVSTSDSKGSLGKFRYLLFDIKPTETSDGFGNTFYSEIDVVELNAPVEPVLAAVAAAPLVVTSVDGYCTMSIDTSKAPELKAWAEEKLAPVLAEWYPKIAKLLASDGFTAPKRFSLQIAPGNGVAATGGTRITANSTWLKGALQGEAVGAIVHEVVHVMQQYNRGRGGSRPPGWLVEGIPDYVRFFLYEPQSHGADVVWFRARRNTELNYDGLYRVSANFLDYVIRHYDPSQTLLATVNAACRNGEYKDEMWKELTGKALQELNEEWKGVMKSELAGKTTSAGAGAGLTEKSEGWKSLFNGVDFSGWHNFKREGVRPGWQVKDGVLSCVDPHDAGDLVTAEKFEWFELELEYNISAGGNSGILFRVSDEGGAVWASGPEFQIEDNAKAADPQRCGWLYALYQPADDPKTGKPLDATKPAGEWNRVRLVVSPAKCEHYINGVKYFEYVLGSDDFNQRVAKSKFSRMPLFAKSKSGRIALQGDHGQVSFRNIRIRPLP